MSSSRVCGAALASLLLLSVASCVSESGSKANAATDASQSQPRTSTYSCSDGGMVTIENLGTSVRVLGPDGDNTELPASPVNQRSRYGIAADAIVLDGQEALVMKGGAPPLTCTR